MKKNKVRRMNQKSADPSNWACVDTFNRRIFDTGRYLIIGGLIAAAMQTYLPTRIMLTLGSTKILAIIIMLLLAFTMSLCSEADAFIGSSLLSLFGTAPVAAFWSLAQWSISKIY